MKEIKRKDELVKIIEKYFTEDNEASFTLEKIFYFAMNGCLTQALLNSTCGLNSFLIKASEELNKTYRELCDFYRS